MSKTAIKTDEALPLIDYATAGNQLVDHMIYVQNMIHVLINLCPNEDFTEGLMMVGNTMGEYLVKYCEDTGKDYEVNDNIIPRKGTEQDEGATEAPSGPDLREETRADAEPF